MPNTRMNKHVAMISHPAGLAWSRTSGSDRIVASNKVGIPPPVCWVFLRAVRATLTDRGQADANGYERCTTRVADVSRRHVRFADSGFGAIGFDLS